MAKYRLRKDRPQVLPGFRTEEVGGRKIKRIVEVKFVPGKAVEVDDDIDLSAWVENKMIAKVSGMAALKKKVAKPVVETVEEPVEVDEVEITLDDEDVIEEPVVEKPKAKSKKSEETVKLSSKKTKKRTRK